MCYFLRDIAKRAFSRRALRAICQQIVSQLWFGAQRESASRETIFNFWRLLTAKNFSSLAAGKTCIFTWFLRGGRRDCRAMVCFLVGWEINACVSTKQIRVSCPRTSPKGTPVMIHPLTTTLCRGPKWPKIGQLGFVRLKVGTDARRFSTARC